MSRLDDYVEGAVSTESTIDEVKVNKQFLTHMIAIHIASGNIIDQIKKRIFYNRQYDHLNISDNLLAIDYAYKHGGNLSYADINEEEIIDVDPRIFHAILGAATESVELLEALEFNGKEMDLVNIGEEFGDLNWYQAIFCDAAGIKWDNILDTNANKLFKKKEARYKDGFSDKDANNRNLTEERKVLDELKIKSS